MTSVLFRSLAHDTSTTPPEIAKPFAEHERSVVKLASGLTAPSLKRATLPIWFPLALTPW